MPLPLFVIRKFSRRSLCAALSNEHASDREISTRGIVKYLCGYLNDLKCLSLVIEPDYTDRDFLDDFAEYYVRCYPPYKRHCKRIHFFKTQISRKLFLRAIRAEPGSEKEKYLTENYLGFAVARPLPQAIIGRTVLKTYESDRGRRHYTCLKSYSANLFGVKCQVNSLAFQEQDTVVAACATVALWSSFQKTAELFGTPTPTPAEITKAANQAIHLGRPIPSHGLLALQMCRAIRQFGFEPELIDVRDERYRDVSLVSLLYGYLRMGLPVILGVDIERHGRHAITLTGFSLRPDRPLDSDVRNGKAPNSQGARPRRPSIGLIGSRIDRLFGHDDQIGPFARLEVYPTSGSDPHHWPLYFESDWRIPQTRKKSRLDPVLAIVPVYHKIRLNFVEVLLWITALRPALEYLLSKIQEPSEWDIHLNRSNDLKGFLKGSGLPNTRLLDSLLLEPHPRFVWRAVLSLRGIKLVELWFDATGFGRSFPLHKAIWHHLGFALALHGVIDNPALMKRLQGVKSKRIETDRLWSFLRKSIEEQLV